MPPARRPPTRTSPSSPRTWPGPPRARPLPAPGPNPRPHQIAVPRDSLLLCARQSWHADHGDLCLSRSRRSAGLADSPDLAEGVPPASHAGALPGRGRCGRRPGHGRRGSLTPAESSLVKTFRNLFLVSRGTNVASVLAVEAGLSLTAGLLQGQREDPRHGRGPAARGVRDGPGWKCSCRATSRAGSRDPGGVPAPASHAGWGIDWRAADAADREVAADAAKGARWCTSALMPRIRSGWSGPAVTAGRAGCCRAHRCAAGGAGELMRLRPGRGPKPARPGRRRKGHGSH